MEQIDNKKFALELFVTTFKELTLCLGKFNMGRSLEGNKALCII